MDYKIIMQQVEYIMVTNWDHHWDKLSLRNNSTLFTLPIIKDNLANSTWPSEAVTLFIKRTKENIFEKAWLGKTKNFRKDPNNGKPAIRFEVAELVEIDCPQEYKTYANGWHLNKHPLALPSPIADIAQSNHLQPAFFNEMKNCKALTFELHCFHLLRLLGIHDILKFPQDDNRGKADGFFRFHTLSVIYDATIETNFQKKKGTQIENYINQLKKEKVSLNSLSYTIKDTQRQVWVITRGNSVEIITTEDHIKVKEIPFAKLIEVYNKRLNEEIGMDDLCNILKDLS